MDNSDLYYIQKGWCGNAILWWRENNSGYTEDIKDAKRFTLDEIREIVGDHTYIAWSCAHVDQCTESHKTIIDGNYLNSDYKYTVDRLKWDRKSK